MLPLEVASACAGHLSLAQCLSSWRSAAMTSCVSGRCRRAVSAYSQEALSGLSLLHASSIQRTCHRSSFAHSNCARSHIPARCASTTAYSGLSKLNTCLDYGRCAFEPSKGTAYMRLPNSVRKGSTGGERGSPTEFMESSTGRDGCWPRLPAGSCCPGGSLTRGPPLGAAPAPGELGVWSPRQKACHAAQSLSLGSRTTSKAAASSDLPSVLTRFFVYSMEPMRTRSTRGQHYSMYCAEKEKHSVISSSYSKARSSP